MKKLLTLMLILSLVALAFAGPFKDVREDNRYYDYIVNLVDKGVIKANPGTEFKGTSPLTKEEAVVWMTKSVSYVENSPLIA
ncbi:MAG TPA: S-layer homology domain-containing protein, partial [Petrotogaceae bacterium]|nr:S-layer homology domain-containing protein [Petrotogaceae bacterium]